jgi:ribosomal protein L23
MAAEVKYRKGLARGVPKRRLGKRLADPNRIVLRPLIARKQRAASRKREAAKAIADPWSVLRFVLMTEKCVRMIEADNVMVFIANRSADKFAIASSFEKAFGQNVRSVKTVIDRDGRKKAFIRLKNPGAAGDIAIKLGII